MEVLKRSLEKYDKEEKYEMEYMKEKSLFLFYIYLYYSILFEFIILLPLIIFNINNWVIDNTYVFKYLFNI